MNETTERFFQEIATHIGYDRVVELHLFPVIRQSGVECAVAVVAAELEPPADDAAARSETESSRHVVYTARYRHTVKGTERGKWAVDVVAEADAPLVTIDAVVRGVVQRSGEEFQPERISGEQFRAIVPAPPVPEPEPA